MTTTTKKEKVSAEVKNYVTENINEMAESHIECWKDRYFRKSKKDISFDLNVNHDSSLEIERVSDAFSIDMLHLYSPAAEYDELETMLLED